MRRTPLFLAAAPLLLLSSLALLPNAKAEHPAPASAAEAVTYSIDNAHSAVIWKINHLGFSNTWGRFNDVQGSFLWDEASPAKSSVTLVIDAASIDSNSEDRDKHLRGPDFFDVKQFPTIKFSSTKVEKKGANFKVSGDLELHGIKKAITVELRKVGEGDSPFGDHRMGFDGEFTIQRSDFGINYMPEGLGAEVPVHLSFEGVRQ